MPKQIKKKDKIVMFPVCIYTWQSDWIDKNLKFNTHKFFRDQLTKYISMREAIKGKEVKDVQKIN